MKIFIRTFAAILTAMVITFPTMAFADSAYLEITLKIDSPDRGAAAGVYSKYKQPFLDEITGAKSKELLIREDDVQVLHGFSSLAEAEAYLSSELFNNDVVVGLKPYLKAAPEVRVYSVF
jgi:hypothetical protein